MQYIHAMKYYSAIKKKEILSRYNTVTVVKHIKVLDIDYAKMCTSVNNTVYMLKILLGKYISC